MKHLPARFSSIPPEEELMGFPVSGAPPRRVDTSPCSVGAHGEACLSLLAASPGVPPGILPKLYLEAKEN